MLDGQGLEVTVSALKQIALINQITETLFRKKSGIDQLLPFVADKHSQCPMLQIYTAIMFFFSFSKPAIEKEFSKYLNRIDQNTLNVREKLYFDALNTLKGIDFDSAINVFKKILKKYPQDKVAILMLETCGFIGGRIEQLEDTYRTLLTHHGNDPDYLGMVGFLYCHLDKKNEAKALVNKGLEIDPHNAWLQHVYVHTVENNDSTDIQCAIIFMKRHTVDWIKHSRFFEGHNWMHLSVLEMKVGSGFESILRNYSEHVWGKCKSLNFEQNNAFLVLWNADICGYSVPQTLWQELAYHAEPFTVDYFTPYLTVTAILAVAKVDFKKATIAIEKLNNFTASLRCDTYRYYSWHDVALPVLMGCLAYIQRDYQVAENFLAPVVDKIRAMGHSDEQREIFLATLMKVQQENYEKKTDYYITARPF